MFLRTITGLRLKLIQKTHEIGGARGSAQKGGFNPSPPDLAPSGGNVKSRGFTADATSDPRTSRKRENVKGRGFTAHPPNGM